MSPRTDKPKRLRGGWGGPLWVIVFIAAVITLFYGLYVYPGESRSYGNELAFNEGMFGPKIEQPIAFSHRVHVTDKHIDCYYCHPFGERSMNAGLPSADKCLGCHNYIIPEHEEILKLKAFDDKGEHIPWTRVYYNPDHVYFPHYMHLRQNLRCQQCHGEVEQVDRLNQVTFYMGFCIDCHKERKAPLECTTCHQ